MKRKNILLVILLLGTFFVPAGTWAQPTIKVGVASMITPVSAVKYYQQVVEYLGRKLGVPAEMVHRTTYDEIDVMLENQEVDLAFICSSPYVLNNQKFGVELLVAPQVGGLVTYHSNIIVHKDSTITNMEQLRGKSFVFVDPKSNSGRLYPTYCSGKAQRISRVVFLLPSNTATATINPLRSWPRNAPTGQQLIQSSTTTC